MRISEEKKNILIINLTRMGDLLQTTPLIVGLKEKYPFCRVSLLVSSVFSEICKGFPSVDKVHVLDIPRLKREISDKRISLVSNYKYLEKEIEYLKSQEFDLIFNIALSKTSALITYLLESPEITGFTMDSYGHKIIRNPWINYFTSKLFNREYNLFNLVDILLGSVGLSATPRRLFYQISERGEAYLSDFLKRNHIRENELVIGFQPGASKKIRQWPTSYFSDLGEILIKDYHARILLFGTNKERELGEEIEKNLKRDRVCNLIGETGIDEAAALLSRCDYLITGDTGTMHLATAVGTRVIALFFGSAYCVETGPYGEGHIVIQANLPCMPCYQNIECKNPLCQKVIEPQDVIRGLELSKRVKVDGMTINEGGCRDQTNIYHSRFDKDNFLEFVPLKKRGLTKKDIYRYCFKEMWKRVLNKETDIPIDADELTEKISLLFSVNGDYEEIFKSMKEDMDSFTKLSELSSEGTKLSLTLIEIASSDLNKNLKIIKDTGKQLEKIDEEISSIGVINKFIKPLTFMFRFGKENLTENELLPLSEKTFELYDFLNKESTLMVDLIQRVSKKILSKRGERAQKRLKEVV